MANQEQATEQVQETTSQEQGTGKVQGANQETQAIQQGLSVQEQIKNAMAPLKNQIDSLNRKNNELAKEKRDAELAKLPEKEQYEARLKELDERNASLAQKEKAIARKEIVDQMAKKYKLTDKLAERLMGDTAAEIELDAKYLSDFVAQEVQTTATETINKKLSGNPPVGGETTVLTGIAQLQQGLKAAKANGNDNLAMQYEVAILDARKKE